MRRVISKRDVSARLVLQSYEIARQASSGGYVASNCPTSVGYPDR